MDSKLDHEAFDQKVEAVEHAPNRDTESGNNLAHKDKAAEFLQHAGQSVVVTPEENKRILRKIDLTILPIMLAVYFLQGLDKATLSYASVFGLVTDTHLGGQDYSWLGSIVYVAQLVMQPIIAYFLVKLPTGKFAAVMVLCWGVVLSFMALAKDFKGLLATRFFLGGFEAAVGKSDALWRDPGRSFIDLSPSPNFRCNLPNVVDAKRADKQKRLMVFHEWNYKHGWKSYIVRIGSYPLRQAPFISGQLSQWSRANDVLLIDQIIFLTCGLVTVVFSIVVL
jgi:hypothetical protein